MKEPMDPAKIFERRADLDTAEEGYCDDCGTPLVFALQAGEDTFSVDLFTILNCLKLAEADAYVPKIPDEWWNDLKNHFKDEF